MKLRFCAAAAARGEELAAARERDGAVALQRARGDGRGQRPQPPELKTLVPRGQPARPLRDDHRLLRLRPADRDRRSAPRARPAAPARADVHVRARRARPVPAEEQRRTRLRRPRDLVLPRRLPAGELQGVPRMGSEGAPRRPAPLLPQPHPRGRATGGHAVRRRRHPRQQAVRLGDLGAIQQRRADVEVDRRLLYLQPDPAAIGFVDDSGKATAPGKPPATFAAIMAAVSSLPRQEPILDDLLDVAAHNERVERIRDVIETSFSGVAEFVEGIIGAANELPRDPRERGVRGLDEEDQRADDRAGRLRVRDVPAPEDQRDRRPLRADRSATSATSPPTRTTRSSCAASSVAWADERKLFQQEGEPTRGRSSRSCASSTSATGSGACAS